MGNYDYRYYLRLDEQSEQALNHISRCTFASKSMLMRRYVQQGVARDIKLLADQFEAVARSSKLVETCNPENDSSLFGFHNGLDERG